MMAVDPEGLARSRYMVLGTPRGKRALWRQVPLHQTELKSPGPGEDPVPEKAGEPGLSSWAGLIGNQGTFKSLAV